MSNIFLAEDNTNEHKVFESFLDAVKYAVDYINDPCFTDEEKKDLYKELLLSIVERDVEKWGKGYCLDELLWCWEVPFYSAGNYKSKENEDE